MKIYNEDGKYTDEFMEHRWNLRVAIFKQGHECMSGIMSFGATHGNGPVSLGRIDKLISLVSEFNALEERQIEESKYFSGAK